MKRYQAKRKVQSEVTKARGHLRGALDYLFDDTDTIELSSTRQTTMKNTMESTGTRGRAPKRLTENAKVTTPMRSTRTNNTASPVKTPAKRKASQLVEISSSSDESDAESAQPSQPTKGSEPFIMKLFERSVDLSKFPEDTPLYPLIRAWFKNQPHNSEIERKPNVLVAPLSREIDAAALYERVLRNEITEIYEMPRPLPTNLPRIPPAYKPTAGYDLAAIDAALQMGTTGKWADTKELLENHKLRWRIVRKEWIKHTIQYRHERYKYNYLIIQHLYKQHKLKQREHESQ